MVKIWLIKSLDPKRLYIAAKHLHCIADGLDMLQVFSLMQDSKSDNAKVTNSVLMPYRNKASLFWTIVKIPASLWSLHCLLQREF